MESKIKAIIIDDEELARKVILKYLENHPDIEVIDTCENGFCGLKSIQENRPELIFLDIQMPKINGFELLELLDEKPVIIFSTAHDEFAIKAFEHSAMDYLLKPYSQKRFSEAVQKAVERIRNGISQKSEIDKLEKENQHAEDFLRRIVVKDGNRVQIIPTEEIIYLEAAGDYVEIHTPAGRFLKQQTMQFFEQRLNPSDFIRVHRSWIVAAREISKLEPYSRDNYMLILKNSKEISVSKSGMKLLRERLQF
jgi:two-component system, LytTR family, response regulator